MFPLGCAKAVGVAPVVVPVTGRLTALGRVRTDQRWLLPSPEARENPQLRICVPIHPSHRIASHHTNANESKLPLPPA